MTTASVHDSSCVYIAVGVERMIASTQETLEKEAEAAWSTGQLQPRSKMMSL
jgi:hypothetical protein